MLNNIIRSALLLVLAAAISACGFHLRGNIPLDDNIKNMFVSAPDGPFKDQLEKVLTTSGARLSATEAGADVLLVVTKAETSRSVGTLDELGKANSYNLKFKVNYSLNDPAGANIRPSSRLAETRQYNFDPERVIESEAEEAELQESMEQDIALRIVRQLSSITDYVATDTVAK
jgi:LPS-assembly lipoprotein